MQPMPAPCLGCTLFCERREGRRMSKAAREKCRAQGGNLTQDSSLQVSITPEDPTYPCELRSEKSVRTTKCKSCRGEVLLKVFECSSPEVDQPLCTIGSNTERLANCSTCQVRAIPGAVFREKIVAGVTTAKRKKSRLEGTLASIREAGFHKILVFADAYDPGDVGFDVTIRESISRIPLGGWPNFFLGLSELYHTFPTAGLYAMFQDDVVVSPGLADYLTRTVDNSFPVWSAFNAAVNQTTKQGWQKVDRGFSFCGAQALIFTNEWVRKFLSDPEVVRYRRFPGLTNAKNLTNDGRTHIDGVVGRFARKQGKKGVAVHHPSLVAHTGDTSVMHPNSTPGDKHRIERVYLGDSYPLHKSPHVGCMMICGGSPDRKRFTRFAIEDFLKQDYRGFATLVIYDFHEEPIYETDGIADLIADVHFHPKDYPRKEIILHGGFEPSSTGTQRQALLDFVKKDYPLLLQWDDDDRVEANYLSYRVSTCPPGAATILGRETLFYDDASRPDAQIELKNTRLGGFPGTIMFPSCFDVRYPDLDRHEDTEFAEAMAHVTSIIPLQNDPSIYMRRVHSSNLSPPAHFERLRRLETPNA